MKSTAWRWLLEFARPYRLQLGFGITLAAFTSLLTVLIPSLVGRLISGLDGLDKLNVSRAFEPLADSAITQYGWLLIGLLAGRTMCGFLSSYALGTAAARTITHLRQGFLQRLLAAPVAFHDQQPSAGLIAAMTADAGFIEQSLNSLLPALAQHGPLILMVTVLALLNNPTLTLTLLIAGVPFVILVALAGQRIRGIAQRGQDLLAQAAVTGQEGLQGVRLIKSLNSEAWVLHRFSAILKSLLGLKQQRVLWVALLEAALPLGAILGVLAVAWVVRGQLADNAMSPARLVTFASYLAILAASARPLLSAYTGLESMLGATDRLAHLAGALGAPEDLHTGAAAAAAHGHVVFQDVSFAFGEGAATEPAVDPAAGPAAEHTEARRIRGVQHLSFNIAAGEVVAITGHNGAGKSTVAQLLLRFHVPQHGRIVLDGACASEVALADWRRRFALVTRDPVLFGVSISENIQLGRLDATPAEITLAAEAVGLHPFITSLPQGYHTPVGEAGVRLSAGQRQRIALARVFLQNPAVVILDEATHSLDAESEAVFWAALAAWRRKRTLIVISHQPVAHLPVTHTIRIEQGRIVSDDGPAADDLVADPVADIQFMPAMTP